MIGHESIVTRQDVCCQCGHVLMLAEEMPREIVWSTTAPSPAARLIQSRWDQHIAELADRKLYGFDGDEYLQSHPEAVYETWEGDNDLDGWLEQGSPLEILEYSVTPTERIIPSAALILERIAEDIGDECGYEEAGEAADRACRHPDVVEAAEALRSAIAAHFTGWLSADKPLRTLIVTWDADGEPLLDGEPMYRKVAP